MRGSLAACRNLIFTTPAFAGILGAVSPAIAGPEINTSVGIVLADGKPALGLFGKVLRRQQLAVSKLNFLNSRVGAKRALQEVICNCQLKLRWRLRILALHNDGPVVSTRSGIGARNLTSLRVVLDVTTDRRRTSSHCSEPHEPARDLIHFTSPCRITPAGCEFGK